MKSLRIVLLSGLLIIACSCKCSKDRASSLDDYSYEATEISSTKNPVKDIIVSLSFLGTALGEPIDVNDKDLHISYETTVTEDVFRIYEAEKKISFDGIASQIQMKYYTVNDVVSEIWGRIESDYISKPLIYTYGAKYGNPTLGRIEDPRIDGSFLCWDFKNQSIHIRRDCSKEWNLDARPMREEWRFKYTLITYEDYALKNKADSIRKVQGDYDREMKPIRDSIEAARKKAIEDSLKAIERNRLMKDAHQI